MSRAPGSGSTRQSVAAVESDAQLSRADLERFGKIPGMAKRRRQSKGRGRQRPAQGRKAPPRPPARRASARKARLRALKRPLQWLAENAGRAALGAIVTAAVGLWLLHPGDDGKHAGPPAPLAKQWQHERARIARSGLRIVERRSADVRGPGQQSTILVLRPTEASCTAEGSDEFRVYDVINQVLKRTFTFAPVGHRCGTWAISIASIEDVLGEGRQEVLAAVWGTPTGPVEVDVPVLLRWDDRTQRYTVTPVLRDAPQLVRIPNRTQNDKLYVAAADALYLRALRLGPSIARGYGVDQFALVRRHQGPGDDAYLVGLYRRNSGVRKIENGVPAGPPLPSEYQEAVWLLDTSGREPFQAGWCDLRGKRVAAGDPDKHGDDVLHELRRSAPRRIQSCVAAP
jgi:hypothetical protein